MILEFDYEGADEDIRLVADVECQVRQLEFSHPFGTHFQGNTLEDIEVRSIHTEFGDKVDITPELVQEISERVEEEL